MGIIDHGDGMSVVRDGVREEIQPTSYGIDGKTAYDFNQDSGVLKINRDMVPEGTLEQVSRAIGRSPDGISVVIPMAFHKPAELQGVREVQYLSENEVNVERTEGPTLIKKPKYNFLSRFFRRT